LGELMERDESKRARERERAWRGSRSWGICENAR